jgi:hypothetical protein
VRDNSQAKEAGHRGDSSISTQVSHPNKRRRSRVKDLEHTSVCPIIDCERRKSNNNER